MQQFPAEVAKATNGFVAMKRSWRYLAGVDPNTEFKSHIGLRLSDVIALKNDLIKADPWELAQQCAGEITQLRITATYWQCDLNLFESSQTFRRGLKLRLRKCDTFCFGNLLNHLQRNTNLGGGVGDTC